MHDESLTRLITLASARSGGFGSKLYVVINREIRERSIGLGAACGPVRIQIFFLSLADL